MARTTKHSMMIRIICILALCAAMATPAFSWNLGIGPSAYYSVWTPEFIGQHRDAEVDPTLLAGGIVSVQFYERFIMSLQPLFSVANRNTAYTVDVPSAAPVELETSYSREEVELSLMYVLSSRFRVSAGYKMMNFDEIEQTSARTSPAYTLDISKFSNQFHIQGPGAGVSASLPISGNLSASLSTSVLYFTMTYYGYFLQASGSTINSEHVDYTYTGIGNNTALVFSYFFESINTSLNLGTRCQVIKYKNAGGAPKLDYDLNYGVTFSALYIFSF